MEIRFTSDDWCTDLEIKKYYALKKRQKEIEETLSEKSPEYLKKYNELLEKLLCEFGVEKNNRKPLPTANIIGDRKEILSLW